jgi:hypothetical protein
LFDSVRESEADETVIKRAVLRAIASAPHSGDFLMADILLLDNIDSLPITWQISCVPMVITW